jgi:hypothetical protein
MAYTVAAAALALFLSAPGPAQALAFSGPVPEINMAGTWVGTVTNCYPYGCMSGVSWMEVKRTGKYQAEYRAWTLAKKPQADCVSFNREGWTGKLYQRSEQAIYAVNDGSDEGYLVVVSKDRQSAYSTYAGAEIGTVETNNWHRAKPKDAMALLREAQPFLCK